MRAGVIAILLLGCAPSASPALATPFAAAAPMEESVRRAEPARSAAVPAPAPRSLAFGASRLVVQLGGDGFDLGAEPIIEWIARSARAVADYYGVFPVPEATLVVHPARGGGVHGGHTQPGTPPRIDIRVGRRATREDLERNWSLTHELVHLGFPNLARHHLWLEEGLASYVEPIVRARAGALAEDDVWREWLHNLERGLPLAGDRGLDHTPTWARTYWGGALFCFLADRELRRQSSGRVELRDALRAIVEAGGNINQRWPIERALRVGDDATRSSVLSDLYRQMKDAPVTVDLDGIWRELGVSDEGGRIRFDDAAPLAQIRKPFVLGRPATAARGGATRGR